MKLKSVERSNEDLRANYVDALDDSELCHAKISELETIIKELKDKESEKNSKHFKTIQSEIQKKDEVTNKLRGQKV